MHSALPAVALLAGGLATRMRPVTETVPKSLLTVAGEPFLAHQLRLLAREGVRDVVLCCGYLGEQIEDFARDGAAYGCRIRYSHDGGHLLGTGGALRRALPLLGEHFFVLYGDSYLPVNFARAYDEFLHAGSPALITVFRNEGRWDASNAVFREGRVELYEKNLRSAQMKHIDYGLGVLKAGCFSLRRDGEAFDLGEIYSRLAREGKLAGLEAAQRFYEIGSRAGLVETEEYLSGVTA